MTNIAIEQNREYDMLEFSREKEIPYIRGRGIRIDSVYCLDYKTDKQNIYEIAKGRSLPLRAVRQAIEWCTLNDALVTRVLTEARKKAGVKD